MVTGIIYYLLDFVCREFYNDCLDLIERYRKTEIYLLTSSRLTNTVPPSLIPATLFRL